MLAAHLVLVKHELPSAHLGHELQELGAAHLRVWVSRQLQGRGRMRGSSDNVRLEDSAALEMHLSTPSAHLGYGLQEFEAAHLRVWVL